MQQKYYQFLSYGSDSTQIERIFTLQNQLVRTVRKGKKTAEFQELTLEEYDLQGQLTHRKIVNLFNSKFISTYYDKGEQVAQLIYRGEHKYSIYRKGYDKPRERLENDFEPYPKDEKARFPFLLSQKTRIEKSKWPEERQLIVVGVLVDESGEVKSVEWANPLGADPEIAKIFVKAVSSWKKGYIPAKDAQENPLQKWRYFYFHAGGKFAHGPIEVSFRK
ncbi:hypothetical protein Aconfl_21040 [Algoriphagus confluentis]|uniref:TonB C-terminal domain-containing protein n=2 Tax=Algoriphagus confluentis TaxID=1697556 RepID=A0ABQ6PP63_9BACT|nr:hypothetical protein Aconfl_21040 [Algoriphagus confluentis]